jgi:hypothetical protein
MSYLAQTNLEFDPAFGSRNRAVLTQQAVVFKDDARLEMQGLALAILQNDALSDQIASVFLRMLAAAPGFADIADNGDGTVDSAKVTDEDMLSAVQALWPTVAALFFPPGS